MACQHGAQDQRTQVTLHTDHLEQVSTQQRQGKAEQREQFVVAGKLKQTDDERARRNQ